MENLYLVDYEVDTGWDYVRDQALVFADCKNTAKYRLSEAVEKIGNEYMVTHIHSVKEFSGDVFSQKFRIGCK